MLRARAGPSCARSGRKEGRRLFLNLGPGTERYLRLFLGQKEWEVMQRQLLSPRSLQKDFVPQISPSSPFPPAKLGALGT